MRRLLPSAFCLLLVTTGASAEEALPRGVTAVEMKVVSDRIFVPATLNGTSNCQCLIDTGSEVTLLNKARVDVKGLKLGMSETLAGDMIGPLGTRRSSLETLAIGELKLNNVAIGVLEHKQGQKFENIDFLLGTDVLGKLRFSLDFANSRMLIWPANVAFPRVAKEYERFPVSIQRPYDGDTRPWVRATINGKLSVNFLFDTGADAPMVAAFKSIADFGVSPGAQATTAARINDSSGTRQLNIYPAMLDTLEFGKAKFEKVPARVLDATVVSGAIAKQELPMLQVLGTPFLKTLSAVHVDMGARMVYFERKK